MLAKRELGIAFELRLVAPTLRETVSTPRDVPFRDDWFIIVGLPLPYNSSGFSSPGGRYTHPCNTLR